MSEKPTAHGKTSFDIIDQKILLSEIKDFNHEIIADFACGVGNYSFFLKENLPENKLIYALDLWEEGIDIFNFNIKEKNTENIKTFCSDLSKPLPVPFESVDAGILATVAHDLMRDNVFEKAALNITKTLKKNSSLFVIEFKKEVEPPPGPPANIRISHRKLSENLKSFGFEAKKTLSLGQFTYLSIFNKK